MVGSACGLRLDLGHSHSGLFETVQRSGIPRPPPVQREETRFPRDSFMVVYSEEGEHYTCQFLDHGG